MSTNDERPGNTAVEPNYRDAKAQAKAAKAYAKAQRPWFKKKRFILPLILLVIIMISVAVNGGDDKGDDTSGKAAAPQASAPADGEKDAAPAEDEKPAEDAAPAFPGAQKSDVVGKAGDELKIGKASVTATPLKAGDDTLGKTVCSSATLKNGSDKTVDFNIFDWKLQAPSGTISTSGFAGSDKMLSSGEIAPGGTASGDVCFDGDLEAGQYVLLYEPVLSFFSDRAAWINEH